MTPEEEVKKLESEWRKAQLEAKVAAEVAAAAYWAWRDAARRLDGPASVSSPT